MNQNQTRTFTQEEVQAFITAEEELRKVGFIVDLGEPGAQENALKIRKYFDANPNIPVTLKSIYAFIEQDKSAFAWFSPAETEYRKNALENPVAAHALAQWFESQGKPGKLANSGDEYFTNSVILLQELRGREVNAQTIFQAEGRISNRAGKRLSYVPMPRAVDPRQHADSGKFLGDVNKTPADYAREALQRTEANNPQPAEQKQKETNAWRTLSEDLLRYGNHANQAVLKQLAENLQAQGAEWRFIHGELTKQVNEFKKRAAVSGMFR